MCFMVLVVVPIPHGLSKWPDFKVPCSHLIVLLCCLLPPNLSAFASSLPAGVPLPAGRSTALASSSFPSSPTPRPWSLYCLYQPRHSLFLLDFKYSFTFITYLLHSIIKLFQKSVRIQKAENKSLSSHASIHNPPAQTKYGVKTL